MKLPLSVYRTAQFLFSASPSNWTSEDKNSAKSDKISSCCVNFLNVESDWEVVIQTCFQYKTTCFVIANGKRMRVLCGEGYSETDTMGLRVFHTLRQGLLQ